ncbi:DUF4902 domain-containing protein [Burkholderia plantarii]|uniref:DUF4902 domain-containing protein n=1 Tax=Burkholderia plantarii TaxID=41899 RepID=UPI0006D8BA7D|nr:DUF4902 domain-containing protein [Burkholderia plantarii]GLZ22993.1 hypothetical protein Bpla01_65220 [Burkholderia plantarii]
MPDDGRLHLTRVELERIALQHRWSALDDEVRETLAARGVHCLLCGVTEWQSRHPAGLVSVGWAWLLKPVGEAELAPGSIGSNLMLTGEHGEPLGRRATDALLRARLATLGWQADVYVALARHWPRKPLLQ